MRLGGIAAVLACMVLEVGSASAGPYFGGAQLIVGDHSGGLYRFDATNGAFLGNTSGVSAWDITNGPNDTLLVADKGFGGILRYDARTGDLVGVAVAPGTGGLGISYGVRVGPDQKLYVADYINQRIKRYDLQTGAFLDDFVSTFGSSPARLAFDSDGNLLATLPNPVPTDGAGQIMKVNPDRQLTGLYQVQPAQATFDEPFAVVARADGLLYVSSENSNRDDTIVRFNAATGAYLGAFIDGIPSAPFGLTFDGQGDLFVATSGGKVLRYNGTTGAFISEFADLSGYGAATIRSLEFVPAVPEPASVMSALFVLGYLCRRARGKPAGSARASLD